jgi:hypothetical protein
VKGERRKGPRRLELSSRRNSGFRDVVADRHRPKCRLLMPPCRERSNGSFQLAPTALAGPGDPRQRHREEAAAERAARACTELAVPQMDLYLTLRVLRTLLECGGCAHWIRRRDVNESFGLHLHSTMRRLPYDAARFLPPNLRRPCSLRAALRPQCSSLGGAAKPNLVHHAAACSMSTHRTLDRNPAVPEGYLPK